MPNYVPTDWQDGITPVDEAHMDKMEAGIVGAVPRDGSVAAAGEIYRSKLLAADTKPAFRQLGDGRMEWAAGNGTWDAALSRETGGGFLKIEGGLSTTDRLTIKTLFYFEAFRTMQATDVEGRFSMTGDGTMWWGSGTQNSQDVTLYRSSAGVLATSNTFQISKATGTSAFQIKKVAGDANPTFRITGDGKMEWGAGGATVTDTNLYRSTADTLKTDDALIVARNLQVDALGQAWSLDFGSVGDVYLYKSAPGRLQLDATEFRVPKLLIGATDTNLYRAGTATLKTDGSLIVTDSVHTDLVGGGLGYGLIFGPGGGGDTYLYRSAAGILKTDGTLYVGGGLDVTGGVALHANLNIVAGFSSGGPSQIQGNTDVVWNKATLYFIDQAALPYTWSVGAGPGQTFSIGDQIRGASVYTVDKLGNSRFIGPQLTVDGTLLVGSYSIVGYGSVNQTISGDVSLWTGAPANRPGFIFGNGLDTNLYRVGAGILQSDGGLVLRIAGNYIPAGHPKQTRSALEMWLSSGSLFTLGETAYGSANPALTMYRTDAGGAVGSGTRLSQQGYPHGLEIQFAPADPAGYGPETYTTSLEIRPNGDIYFGSALDTRLYRSGAGLLRTDGGLMVMGTLYTQAAWALQAFQPGDTNLRLGIYNPGSAIYFGAGNIPEDTYLSRLSPGVLGINGVRISTGGSFGGAVRAYRNTYAAIASTEVTFEGSDYAAWAGWNGGTHIGVNGPGLYQVVLHSRFSNGGGAGDQRMFIKHYSAGGGELESWEVSKRASDADMWNRPQTGTVVCACAAGDFFTAQIHGGATGSPGGYSEVRMTVIKIG